MNLKKGDFMKLKLLVLSLTSASLLCAQSYTDDSHVEYVKVVKNIPVYENQRVSEPYEECHYENVPIHSRRGSGDVIGNNVGTVLGGVAGGVLGHQVGGGHGKTVATVGGAILGSIIGNNVSHRDDRYRDDVARYEKRRVCEKRYRDSTKRVLSGYDNIGYFKGQKITKFSPEALREIPVTTTISY